MNAVPNTCLGQEKHYSLKWLSYPADRIGNLSCYFFQGPQLTKLEFITSTGGGEWVGKWANR